MKPVTISVTLAILALSGVGLAAEGDSRGKTTDAQQSQKSDDPQKAAPSSRPRDAKAATELSGKASGAKKKKPLHDHRKEHKHQ